MGELPFERIKREVLVRKNSRPSIKYGQDPSSRPIKELVEHGIINIDKPSGPSSHQVSAYVRQILRLKKTGHSGTLDPKVTGILPVALGAATRVVQCLLISGKEYVCLMHLHQKIDEETLKKALDSFVGKIKQLPPVKSAVKREWRYRKIYYIEFLDMVEQDVLFRVGCQAGTYIRKLVHDIGGQLGCGAHMAELRRTKAGPFSEQNLVTLQDLTDAFYYYTEKNDESFLRKTIMPIEHAVSFLPKVWVLDTTVDSLCHGATLKAPGISKVETDIQVGEDVAVLTLRGELIAVAEAKLISKEMATLSEGIAAKSTQVFMLPGTYPKVELEK